MFNQEEANPEFSSDESFSEEGEDSSDSDVDAKLAEDDVFDIEFFKCYSALKKRDEKIYDKNVKFFSEQASSEDEEEIQGDSNNQTGRSKSAKAPKMSLLDHQLNLREDEIVDPELERKVPKIDLNKNVSRSFYEKELDEIKKCIEKIGEGVDSDNDDDLLVVKGTSSRPGTSKPRKTIDALLDKMEGEDDEDISHLKQIWSDPDRMNEEDKFLRDYILNKRYIATDTGNKDGFFSKNLDDLSDVSDSGGEQDDSEEKDRIVHRSDEKDFDKIARVPRNATKTYRDLVEKREKKEKRLKKLEKEKKKKKALKDADYEDVVGDLPTKFHYRETEPNDYGLSAEELLMATDEELEKWISLKDAIGYRDPEQDMEQKKRYEARRNDVELKKRIFQSIYGETHPELAEDQPESQIKAKKHKRTKRSNDTGDQTQIPPSDPATLEKEKPPTIDSESKSAKRKKKHKRGLNHKKFAKSGVAPDRLLAYGLSKTKLKKSKLL